MANYTYSTEDENEAVRWLKATSAYCALSDIKEKLRSALKYEDLDSKTYLYVETLDNCIDEILDTHNIDLDTELD